MKILHIFCFHSESSSCSPFPRMFLTDIIGGSFYLNINDVKLGPNIQMSVLDELVFMFNLSAKNLFINS